MCNRRIFSASAPCFFLIIACLSWAGCTFEPSYDGELTCVDGETEPGRVCVDGVWVATAGGGGGGGGGGCAPKSCGDLSAACGEHDDGCGGIVRCGACPGDLVCNADFQCVQDGEGTCTPRTCADVGASCGNTGDGCGGTLDCGSCAEGEVCNEALRCECAPVTCEDLGASCGVYSDGCGGVLGCGVCEGAATCDSATMQCVCEPSSGDTCEARGIACGSFEDTCGDTVECTDGCFESVSAGGQHACGITWPDGGVKCWGDNDYTQLGVDTLLRSARAIEVPGLDAGYVQVAAGDRHTCALAQDGSVRCWGDDTYGQLGDGAPGASMSTPTAVVNLGSALAVVVGERHSCALVDEGSTSSVWCWGRNDLGQLGSGQSPAELSQSSTPVEVTGLSSPVVGLAAGGTLTCAIDLEGVKCWGPNNMGQLGDPDFDGSLSATPRLVDGLGGAPLAVTAADAYACALTDTPGLWCWGLSDISVAGGGTAAAQAYEIPLGGDTPQLVDAGARHACFAHDAGVACWGRNGSGELGDGTTVASSVPVDVALLGAGVGSLSAGTRLTCAVETSTTHQAYCWGEGDDGQLGDGSLSDASKPVVVMPD